MRTVPVPVPVPFTGPPCALSGVSFDPAKVIGSDPALDRPDRPLPAPSPNRSRLNCGTRTLGFFPLSNTRFRALIPTQSTSCFIASRSDTGLCSVVFRLTLVGIRIVLGAVSVPVFFSAGRMGVTSGCLESARPRNGGLGVTAAHAAAVAHFASGSAGTTRRLSSKASLGGPHEKPMNAERPFCDDPAPLDKLALPKAGVARTEETAGELRLFNVNED